MDVRVGPWRELNAEELMLSKRGVREDSWEFLGLQGDQTSQSSRKSVLNIHWKDSCWSWNSNTLATWCEELTHWKRPWCRERLKAQEKGMAEDEMVGWHHWLDGHEFEQTLEDGERQGSLACCSPWGRKQQQLNNNSKCSWRLQVHASVDFSRLYGFLLFSLIFRWCVVFFIDENGQPKLTGFVLSK